VKRLLAPLLLPFLLASAPALAEEKIDEKLEGVGIDQKLGDKLPLDAPFVDSSGNEVRLGDYFGGEKPVVLAIVYFECPMLCTMVLNGLVGSLKTMSLDAGEDFEVVVVSVDPGETPALAAEKKANYVGHYGRPETAAGWHFLTGEEPAIKTVAKAAGYRYRYDEKIDEYVHAAGIMVATPDGTLSRYFFGVEFAPRDLRLGIVEASGGKVGTIVDSIMLFCFSYDPATGKYGFVVQSAIRIGGSLTVLILALFVLRSLRRERKLGAREMIG
jgi:protein SCO1/2